MTLLKSTLAVVSSSGLVDTMSEYLVRIPQLSCS